MTILQKNTPRGIRNNNPCNIRLNPANQWEGRVPVSRNRDGSFEQFSDPIWGLRAAAVLILNHARKNGTDTITKLIRLWAPPIENNTIAYTAKVARLSGFGADQILDFKRADRLKPVLAAMITVENGRQPYSEAQLDQALAKAGVAPSTWKTTIA